MSEQTQTGDPVMPEARLNVVTPKAPQAGIVVSNDTCLRGKSASFVRHTVLDVSGTELAGSFLAGQSFGVIPPGLDERGKPHKVRLYSIACPTWGEDGRGGHVSTTPKRLIEEYRPQKKEVDASRHTLFLGVCSNYLCDLLPGAEVALTGPAGKRFLLPVNPDEHDYLFVAAGTGIAPFRGMALELLERPAPRGPCRSEIHLVMGSPYVTDLLYDDLFRRLAAEHRNFHYHTAISRETRPDGRRGLYTHQLIEEQIDRFGPFLASQRTLVYICGLLGMQEGLFKVMSRHGVAGGYLRVADELAGTHPDSWTAEQVRRQIHETGRCMVEVY